MSYTVIIPSKNPENLRQCVQSIRENGERCRVIVIWDGHEGERPIRMVMARVYRGISVVEGVKPFVYARNCNIGIMWAAGDDVILLNDDAMLTLAGGFSALSQSAAANPDYGIVSAVTNISGNPDLKPRPYLCGLRETLRCAPFICVYIKRTTLDAVGLLDERFTAYGYEDQDYCRRVRNAGLKVGVLDACYVDHGSLTSTYRGDPRAPGDCAAGAAIYREKWGDLD